MNELELEAQKAADLLRAARLLEGLPLLSEAFRSAKVGWGKIRAITRVVTPETERQWLEAALACTTEELARHVALTPRDWKRRAQGETSSAAELSLAFEGEASTGPDTAPADKPAGAVSASRTAGAGGPVSAGVDANAGGSRAGKSPGNAGAHGGRRSPAGDHGNAGAEGSGGQAGDGRRGTRPEGTPPVPLPGPRFVRVTLLFTPEQYAVYEKAQQRISNKRRRRVGREEATTEMARLTLNAAPERSRARHQVVVHVDASTELAWIETERGLHVLTDDQRDEALAVGRVFVTTDSRTEGEQSDRGRSATLGEDVGGQGLLDLDKERSKPGKVRAAVPMPTLRALFARARGRCERCSRRQGLQVHHCTPRSRGGTHDLDELKLFCEQCHRVGHDADFAGDPTWERARARSRRRRQRKQPAEG